MKFRDQNWGLRDQTPWIPFPINVIFSIKVKHLGGSVALWRNLALALIPRGFSRNRILLAVPKVCLWYDFSTAHIQLGTEGATGERSSRLKTQAVLRPRAQEPAFLQSRGHCSEPLWPFCAPEPRAATVGRRPAGVEPRVAVAHTARVVSSSPQTARHSPPLQKEGGEPLSS